MYGQPEAVAYDAEVVISELVTNAVRAGAEHLELAVDAHQNRVIVAVMDDAAGMPVLQQHAPGATSGRGLRIVGALSSRWGVAPVNGHRKTVWADLAVPVGAAATFECAG